MDIDSFYKVQVNKQGKLCIPWKDLKEFKEMNPPDIMPQVQYLMFSQLFANLTMLPFDMEFDIVVMFNTWMEVSP